MKNDRGRPRDYQQRAPIERETQADCESRVNFSELGGIDSISFSLLLDRKITVIDVLDFILRVLPAEAYSESGFNCESGTIESRVSTNPRETNLKNVSLLRLIANEH